MKRFFSWMLMALLSASMMAGGNDLLWDYTEGQPTSSPDNGLYFNNKCQDAGASGKNGLNGIKLNSNGYCCFTKAAVAGRLKLSFGPRSGNNAADIEVWNWSGDAAAQTKGDTKYATTGQQTEYGTQVIELTAEQNMIYLCRGVNTETVLQKIVFKEGTDDTPEPCEIIYKDQNGKVLGKVETVEGASLEAIPDTIVAKLPAIGENERLRGWYYTNNIKAQTGDVIQGNTTIQAHVTPVEIAEAGTVWIYDFTNPTFYPEDHDLISMDGEQITLVLSGDKAVVIVKTKSAENTHRYESETEVTLTETRSQVEKISVYNVENFPEKDEETGYYIVPTGDAASFLLCLTQANAEGNAKIFLPNGTYDLKEMVLTAITANNISIVGQSMEETIIKNAPDAATESIDKTATIKINKNVQGTYLQDLTIQNALDYYKADNGRAVALWDQGTKTVCKNVRLLSYQDTYYSNLQGAVKYFEDCEIHGTVDFICGDGSVYFKNNLLYCEKRKKDGGGSDCITASNAEGVYDRGYVFESCVIASECPVVSFGRAWNNTPQVAFLNTIVTYNAGEFGFENSDIQRWTKKLMNPGAWPIFVEYNTHLYEGGVLTPSSNIVTFVDEKSGNATSSLETVISAEGAANRTMEYTLGDWAEKAVADAKQMVADKANIEPDAIYLIEITGTPYIKKGSDMEGYEPDVDYKLRKANARGGFGWEAGEEPEEEGIKNTTAEARKTMKFFRDGQVIIVRDNRAYNVLGAQL